MKRNNWLDVMRSFGLLCVIMAHVSPPNIIMQLRNFDVPLMVIVSGISYTFSNKNNLKMTYFIQRILRLLAPTWSFLIIYFLYFYVINLVTGNQFVSIETIINSFFLLNRGGIGYVWIIRVFILVAISTPVVDYFNDNVKSNIVYFSSIFICMLCYLIIEDYVATTYYYDKTELLPDIVMDYALYIVPYSLMFALGVRIAKLSDIDVLVLFFLLVLIYLALIVVYNDVTFFKINVYKYPPQVLWIVYWVAVSLFLYLITKNIKSESNVFYFIGSSSIWIYLWHILILRTFEYGFSCIYLFFNNFISKLFLIMTIASIMTYLQKKIISHVIGKIKFSPCIESCIKICFLK